ncbi:hypothetical protein B0H19DRAFT_1373115, partial [Mycena capillaripes]
MGWRFERAGRRGGRRRRRRRYPTHPLPARYTCVRMPMRLFTHSFARFISLAFIISSASASAGGVRTRRRRHDLFMPGCTLIRSFALSTVILISSSHLASPYLIHTATRPHPRDLITLARQTKEMYMPRPTSLTRSLIRCIYLSTSTRRSPLSATTTPSYSLLVIYRPSLLSRSFRSRLLFPIAIS